MQPSIAIESLIPDTRRRDDYIECSEVRECAQLIFRHQTSISHRAHQAGKLLRDARSISRYTNAAFVHPVVAARPRVTSRHHARPAIIAFDAFSGVILVAR